MTTALESQQHDPAAALLLTREDLRRYLVDFATRKGLRHAGRVRRQQQLFRRATLLFVLCFCVLQYYFLAVGLEIQTLPSLSVSVPAAPVQG